MSPRNPKRVGRAAHLRWHDLAAMKVNPLIQRELNQARVDRLVAHLDLEQLGTITVNMRDGLVFIIDGMHRHAALVQWGFDGQIQCWTYDGLTESEEAETFLKLNDTLAVPALARYRAAITAGRPVECDIDRIVRAADLTVTHDRLPGAIGAVGTLLRVYNRSGAAVLSRTLHIVRDAYGDPGMQAAVLDGIGFLCQRYNGELTAADAITRLSGAHGGVNGLLGAAEKIRASTGNAKGQCVAAAAVDLINKGRAKPDRLRSWWRDE